MIDLPRLLCAGGAFFLSAGLAWADGKIDTAAFARCKACHEVRNGEQVIVRGGRNGPNLYGVLGRKAGSLEGYRFSDGLIEAGDAGLTYDLAALEAYAANPNGFLGDYLGNNARSKMPLGFPDFAAEAAAFLAQFADE